jgi:hypothetical protein
MNVEEQGFTPQVRGLILMSAIADRLQVTRPVYSEEDGYWVFRELRIGVSDLLIDDALGNEDKQDELMTNIYGDYIASSYFGHYRRN